MSKLLILMFVVMFSSCGIIEKAKENDRNRTWDTPQAEFRRSLPSIYICL